MKIILTNLPWINNGRWGVRAGSRWPHIKGHTETNYLPFPFYLAYSAALLKKHGFDVTLIDAIALHMGYKEFLNKVRSVSPDLFVAEVSTVSINHDLNFLKQIGGNIPIVLCGPDVNIRNAEFIKAYNYIKYVLTGEYENILLQLAQHLSSNKDLGVIRGLIYRNGNGSIKINPGAQIIEDLDELPWPQRDEMPMGKYIDSPGDLPLPMVQMWSSRGCPFKCKFCLWPQVMYFGNHYRARKVTCVIDEMEYLVKNMGFKSIYFDDDTWNVGKERILSFCSELKKRKLDVPWAIMARPDLMDEEILDNLKNAGLYSLKYGVESATQQLIDNTNKNMDLRKVDRMIRYTKKLDIKMHLTFTFGLDGESMETIMKTIKYATDLDPMSVQFSLATPFPGTGFYNDSEKYNHIVTHKWNNYDGNHSSVIHTENLSVYDLTRAKQIAYYLWEKHCRSRKSYKNNIILQSSLVTKFIRGLKDEGILKIMARTICYIKRKILLLKETIYFEQQIRNSKMHKKVVCDKLEVIALQQGSVKIFWMGHEVTKNVGLTTSFKCSGKWHDSSQAKWEICKINNKKIQISITRWALPIEQIWTIELLDGHNIAWGVEMNVSGDFKSCEQKAGLVLKGRYKKWIDSWGEGQFPKIIDWLDIPIRDINSSSVGVRGDRKGVYRYPTVMLDFLDNKKIFNVQVQNSNRILNARLIQARNTQPFTYQAGKKYDFFRGVIKLWQEK